MRRISIIPVIILFALSACVSNQRVTNSWVSPDVASGVSYRKIFVAVLTSDSGTHDYIENAVAERLEGFGIEVVKGGDDYTPNLSSNEDLEQEQKIAAIRETGCDAIFTVTLLDVITDERYHQGTQHMIVESEPLYFYRSYIPYYRKRYSVIQTPGYYTDEKTFFIESNLYDALSERLVWTVQSEAFNPPGLKQWFQGYSELMMNQLKKDGLFDPFKPTESVIQDKGVRDIKALNESQELFNKGVDFAAGGTNPAWSLAIDFDKVIGFSAHDGLVLNTPPVTGTKAMDANVTFYHAVTEAGELRITISAEQCRDSVSGAKSGYLSRIEARYSSEDTFRSYSGCGRYIFDYRLHDIWVLNEATGVKLDPARLMKGLPVFEFYPEDNKVTGHAGCNNLNARIEVSGHKITFGRIISTKMACPDMSTEQSVFSFIENNTFRYKIAEGILTFMNESGKMMVFKKVD